MNEIQISGYLICGKCNSTNRVMEIGREGVYKCGTCGHNLLVINKEKKGSKIIPLFVASIFLGGIGGVGIHQIHEKLKPSEIIYSELNTSWSAWQVEVFDRHCKANYSQFKPNWSSEKIAKICTCYVTHIVEKIDYPKSGRLSEAVVSESEKECR